MLRTDTRRRLRLTGNRAMPALLIGVLLTCASGGASAPQPAPAPERPMHIYLLLGQSNMGGRGELRPGDRIAARRVHVFTQDGRWAAAAHPLHASLGGVGPGLAFARSVLDADPAADVGLVPCAVGGSSLARWIQGGDLYERTVERALEARRTGPGVIRGVLWHQGEREAGTLQNARLYAPRLRSVINGLRRDLGEPELPVVVGALGDFTRRYPFTTLINDSLARIPKQVPFTAFAPAEGLGHIGDRLHFDASSADELGRRYAEAYLDVRAVSRLVEVAAIGAP